tara:strand:- start:1657 stop:2529 length:873 start_codon:yes stop_codon:yes gene_type:complete
MEISAKLVKDLRDRTGAGMMECKKALVESKGDIEIAIENMRKAGQAKADKKSSRIAAEGVIKINISGDKKFATLLEVNSETDFVAKDENFVKFCNEISELSARENIANLKELLSASYGETNVEEARLQLISKVGENVQIRRYEKLSSSNFGYYLHGTKIGVLVSLEYENENLAKDIAMHIAAMKPLAVSQEGINKELVEKEEEIFLAQAKESGKPENIVHKMVEGKVKKFYEENTLLSQKFVKNSDISIKELLLNEKNSVLLFKRYEVGEGIEKKSENFADEVMSQVNKT